MYIKYVELYIYTIRTDFENDFYTDEYTRAHTFFFFSIICIKAFPGKKIYIEILSTVSCLTYRNVSAQSSVYINTNNNINEYNNMIYMGVRWERGERNDLFVSRSQGRL